MTKQIGFTWRENLMWSVAKDVVEQDVKLLLFF